MLALIDPTVESIKETTAISKREKDEKREVEIFSMLDYQPFYNHYVQDVLKLSQDINHNLNEHGMSLPLREVG